VAIDAVFAIILIGILALIATTIPMDLGAAANPADTAFLPRPEWYYRRSFQWLKYLSGSWSLIGGIILPTLLAVIFAALPFLDRRLERRPWRRPIVVGAFLLFLIAYTDPQLAALLHSPDVKMTAGGMTPVDLKQDDLQALVTYLRQLH
jgi:quinol-cytochrome oxidoreductase complex cytochrome b subunit